MIPLKPYFRKFLILFTGILLLQILKGLPNSVEAFYSKGFFPFLAEPMRAFTGILPFSLGDLLYMLAILWILVLLYNSLTRSQSLTGLWIGFFWKFAWIYLVFNCLWGLNYNRNRIDQELGLAIRDPEKQELEKMVDLFIAKANQYAPAGLKKNDLGSLKLITEDSYKGLVRINPSFDLRYFSLKSSLFGKLGNYLGYSGYYNPFTAEGQVNMYVPPFMLPYVACHEMAHQLGYAKEDEANFVGFLAAKNGNSTVRYSLYFSSFLYANRALYSLDSNLAKIKMTKLSILVQHDMDLYLKYIHQYHTPIESMVDYLYDHYLKLNEQPMGTVTYSRVVIWMAAYFRKYGEL